MNRIPIYVIHLEKSKDRLQRFLQNNRYLEKSRITIFPAIDGFTTTFAQRPNDFTNIKSPNMQIGGTRACWLSHVYAQKQFLQTHHRFALICEDDAIFPVNFYELLEKKMRELGAYPWDILQLYANRRVGRKTNVPSWYQPIPLYKSGVNTGMVAYLVSRHGAVEFTKRLCPIDLDESFLHDASKNSIAIDHYYKRFYEKWNILTLNKNLVIHDGRYRSDRLTHDDKTLEATSETLTLVESTDTQSSIPS